jgi:sortase A
MDSRNEKRVKMKWFSRLEHLLLILGLGLLAVYVGRQIHRITSSWGGLRRFEAIQQSASADSQETTKRSRSTAPPDSALWAKKRIRNYQERLEQHFPLPMAVLRIPRIQLEAPVWEGTDDQTLNRGVGWIAGTARIEETGNVGIAGHRDGFFRGLKDLQIGDRIDLVTQTRTDTYVVDEFQIVSPNDVSVLQSTSTPSLTLVTCYPFYFAGSAPQRFIVRASITDSKPLKVSGNEQASSSFAVNNYQEATK